MSDNNKNEAEIARRECRNTVEKALNDILAQFPDNQNVKTLIDVMRDIISVLDYIMDSKTLSQEDLMTIDKLTELVHKLSRRF